MDKQANNIDFSRALFRVLQENRGSEWRQVVSYLFHCEPEEEVKAACCLSEEDWETATTAVDILNHVKADIGAVYRWSQIVPREYGKLMKRMTH